MEWNKIKKIHFIGIGGIGVSAIAKMFLKQNKIVSGSDLNLSEATIQLEKLGAKIFSGHQAVNLSEDTDLVIYSPAAPEDNPERLKARKSGIPQFSYPQFLGELSKEKFTIAISGTNGKSTTTAILGLLLEKADLDPTVIVGSKVSTWNGNLRLSKSGVGLPILVVEACEWQAHMLNLEPQIIVLTNLEADHLDYYQDLNHIIKTFQKYIDKLPASPTGLPTRQASGTGEGIVVLNVDDLNLNKLKLISKVITYGIKNRADVMAKNIKVKSGRQEFELKGQTPEWAGVLKLSVKVPGIFNVYNMLAAAATALAMGVKPEIIKETLEDFSGIWRRFERVGEKGGAVIISDYAHHPTAVEETIRAAEEFYPNRRIVAVFQPHQHNRTKKLFKEFVKSFDKADLVIISEIYDVAGREDKKDRDVSSQDLVRALKDKNKRQKVYYTRDLAETKKLILKNIQPDDVVLIMGAGDIYLVANELVNNKIGN